MSMENFRKTKIVATLGPATSSPEMIGQLIDAGVNIFRLNFSHGTHTDHQQVIEMIRMVREQKNSNVAILQDVQGPKIRIGQVENGAVTLVKGQTFCFCNETCVATAERASVSYPYLLEDIPIGATILVDDGKLEMKVTGKTEVDLVCEIVHGGVLTARKGVNFPNISLQIAAVTEKDKEDMLFGIANEVEFIAISFVQRASDVMVAKDFLSQHGAAIPIIAKIERQEAINNIEEIIDVSDGIMVARGDMGVEILTELVPVAQKKIIESCNRKATPVITATQMLDSMIHSPRPTRAEASDVANAILDGTDAVMLSNETAAGEFPIMAVKTMHNIAMTIEQQLTIRRMERRASEASAQNIAQAIGFAACQMASVLKASAIISATLGGAIARQVSRHRSNIPLIAATPHEKTWRTMNLLWGVYPLKIPRADDTDSLMRTILDEALAAGLIHQGDTVVLTAGIPAGLPGSTNMVKVETVTRVLAHGMGLGHRLVSGRALRADTAEVACAETQTGDILFVGGMTNRDYMPALQKAGGLITVEGGLTSHAAIVGMSLGIPVILGVTGELHEILTGELITLDPNQGLIFSGTPNMT